MKLSFSKEEIEVANYLYENYYADTVKNAFVMTEFISDDLFESILYEKAKITRMMSKAKGRTIQLSSDRTGDTTGNRNRRKALKRILGALAKKGLGSTQTQGSYKEEGQEHPTTERSYQLAPKPGSAMDNPARLSRIARALGKKFNQDSTITTDRSGATLHYKNPSDDFHIGTVHPGKNPEPDKGETGTRPKQEIKNPRKGQRQPVPQRYFHFR